MRGCRCEGELVGQCEGVMMRRCEGVLWDGVRGC